MLARLRRRFTYANVMSTLAVFLVLGTGTAYATHLVVNSSDVVDESLVSADLKNGYAVRGPDVVDGSLAGEDLANGSVTTADVRNASITGTDVANDSLDTWDIRGLTYYDLEPDTLGGGQINESTLAQVPSATLGGLGRSAVTASCDPESSSYVTCAYVTLSLPRPARVLMVGTAAADNESDATYGVGFCRLATSVAAVSGTVAVATVIDDFGGGESLTTTAVTDVMPAGTYDFGIECTQEPGGAIYYPMTQISAVAISPS